MSSDNTALGDRMKGYEKADKVQFSGEDPIIVRIDGRAFHSLTRGFDKPFDDRIVRWMDFTCRELTKETNPVISYVQSDEISLIFKNKTDVSQPLFGGKKEKIVSILASMATAYFNLVRYSELGLDIRPANFDCRVFAVPSESEAINYLLWRYRDATRNSILSFSQCEFGKKKIWGFNISQLLDRINNNDEIANIWSKISNRNKEGVFMRKEPFCTDMVYDKNINVVRNRIVKFGLFCDGTKTHDELIKYVFNN
jgi:hypothetical protein